jgi:hypothetical protein
MSDDSEHERRNKGGRPATGSTPVNVRLSAATYDAAHARAGLERRRSVPALVRAAVERYLADPDDDRDE